MTSKDAWADDGLTELRMGAGNKAAQLVGELDAEMVAALTDFSAAARRVLDLWGGRDGDPLTIGGSLLSALYVVLVQDLATRLVNAPPPGDASAN
jgi:hypothetical protein